MTTLFVPGRLCLFGEHSDWAGAWRKDDATISAGACIVCGTDQGITASVAEADDFEFVTPMSGGEIRQVRIPMTTQALAAAAGAGDFFSYAASVAAVIRQDHRTGGLRIAVAAMDLPMQRGLSSSAAVCVLVARGFNHVYQLGLTLGEEMDLAYRGEVGAGSLCGRMDQVCAYGQVPVLLRFPGGEPQLDVLRVGAVLRLVIVDLCARKDTRRILADLNACFSGAASEKRHRLRRALGEDNLRIVEAARAAMISGDAAQVGHLMQQAQASFDRDVAPACAEELAAPKLHRVLNAPEVRDLVWGGKGVGSQGDGAAQFVCRGEAERLELKRRLTERYAVKCLDFTIEPGAGLNR